MAGEGVWGFGGLGFWREGGARWATAPNGRGGVRGGQEGARVAGAPTPPPASRLPCR